MPLLTRASYVLSFLPFALVGMWAGGLSASDLARAGTIVCCGLICGELLGRQFKSTNNYPTPPTSEIPEQGFPSNFSKVVLLYYLVLLGCSQIAQYYLGRQGIDFAIFTQAINNFANTGSFQISLVGNNWSDFISHHFVPIFSLPALLTYFGLSPQISGILIHLLAVAGGLVGFYYVARELKFNEQSALVLTLILALNPTLRAGLFWEIRDEILALPFLALLILGILKQSPLFFFLGSGMALTCKETMFLAYFVFLLTYILWNYFTAKQAYSKNFTWLACLFGLVSLVGIYFYFGPGQGAIGRTFSPQARLSNLSQLLEPQSIKSKLYFTLIIFLPLLFSPLWSKKAWIIGLPGYFFLALILISNFQPMYHPYNYYGVLPTYLLSFAALVAIANTSLNRLPPNLMRLIPTLVLCLQFSLAGRFHPAADVVDFLRTKNLPAQDALLAINLDRKVIADDFDVSLFIEHAQVTRLWNANARKTDWDVIALRKGLAYKINPLYLKHSYICKENASWIVRCKKPEL
ncbi:DUF2079 domain-containing protein [bacterium]|nr:DUF2079 domain-containing protein [bacterium]